VPGKLGECVRSFLLARRHGIPFFESLGSVLVCKLLELVALLTVVSIALVGPLGASFSDRLGPALAIAIGACVALLALALSGARWAAPVAAALERRGRLPKLRTALVNLGHGLQATRSPRQLGKALAASFGPVCASALAYGLALQVLGVERGLFAGGIVLGAISLGQLTPGLPIGMGMYYLTSSWAARTLGASEAEAAAFATLPHVATFSTQLLVGFVSLLVHRINPRTLLRQRAEMAKVTSLEESVSDSPALRASGA